MSCRGVLEESTEPRRPLKEPSTKGTIHQGNHPPREPSTKETTHQGNFRPPKETTHQGSHPPRENTHQRNHPSEETTTKRTYPLSPPKRNPPPKETTHQKNYWKANRKRGWVAVRKWGNLPRKTEPRSGSPLAGLARFSVCWWAPCLKVGSKSGRMRECRFFRHP